MKQYIKPVSEPQAVDTLEMLCVSVDSNQTTDDAWARKHVFEESEGEEDKPWDFLYK